MHARILALNRQINECIVAASELPSSVLAIVAPPKKQRIICSAHTVQVVRQRALSFVCTCVFREIILLCFLTCKRTVLSLAVLTPPLTRIFLFNLLAPYIPDIWCIIC